MCPQDAEDMEDDTITAHTAAVAKADSPMAMHLSN
jgi:hypothetical protein